MCTVRDALHDHLPVIFCSTLAGFVSSLDEVQSANPNDDLACADSSPEYLHESDIFFLIAQVTRRRRAGDKSMNE